jgi:NADH dehydrogenase FAD-containing subunit
MVNANGNVCDGARRLKVLIVGGGICGLTCGAALREFADVTVSAMPFGRIDGDSILMTGRFWRALPH